MLVPTKFVPYSDSTLSALPPLLEELNGPVELRELYRRTKSQYDSVELFLYALDVLYLLHKIDVDLQSGEVRRVD